MIRKHWTKISYLVLLLMLIVASNNSNIPLMIISGLSEFLMLISFILLLDNPLLSITSATLSQALYLLVGIDSEVFSEKILLVLIGLLALLIHLYLIDRKLYKENKRVNIKERLKSYCKYKRNTLKIKGWAKYCFFMMIASLTFAFDLSSTSSSKTLGIIQALLIICESITFLLILSTTEAAYYILYIKTIIRISLVLTLIFVIPSEITIQYICLLITHIAVTLHIIIKRSKNELT